MERRVLLLVAISLLLGGSAGALAGPGYSYEWQPNPVTIISDPVSYPGLPLAGKATINFESTGLGLATTSTNVIAGRIWVSSMAPFSLPAHFTDDKYTLALTITDQPSGQSGLLTFQGELSGTAWKHGSLINNTFIGPLSQTIALGNEQYAVTIDAYLPPGPPGTSNAGGFGAEIDMQPRPVSGQPEPSTLALAGLGLALTGLAAWRTRWRPFLAV